MNMAPGGIRYASRGHHAKQLIRSTT